MLQHISHGMYFKVLLIVTYVTMSTYVYQKLIISAHNKSVVLQLMTSNRISFRWCGDIYKLPWLLNHGPAFLNTHRQSYCFVCSIVFVWIRTFQSVYSASWWIQGLMSWPWFKCVYSHHKRKHVSVAVQHSIAAKVNLPLFHLWNLNIVDILYFVCDAGKAILAPATVDIYLC